MDVVAVPWAFLIVVVVGLLLLGGLVAIIVLLANPNTRMAGLILLAIAVLAVLLVGSVGLYLMCGYPLAAPLAMTVSHVGPLPFPTG